MNRILALLAVLAALTLASCGNGAAIDRDSSGFDEYGYNEKAGLFNGTYDGADKVWGNGGAWTNDHLVMNWNDDWDRGNECGWDPNQVEDFENAWTTNHYNGQVPGGSGEVWHYKFKWIGKQDNGAPWPTGHVFDNGSYAIWGQFAVVFSQGTVANEHYWDAHATAAGLGVNLSD